MLVQEMELFGRPSVKVFANRPKSINEILTKQLSTNKKKEAIVTEERALTYEDLDVLSSTIAANLQQKCGIQKGDRVATIIGNRYHFPLLVFACVKLGAIMVPVNVKLSPEEKAYILSHSDVKVIVSEGNYEYQLNLIKEINENALPEEKNIFLIDGEDSFTHLLDTRNQAPDPIEIDELDPAFILYTSGTTGRPKGAVLSYIGVIHSLMNYQSVFNTNSSMKTLIAVPMFHVTGLIGQLLHMVYVGGTSYSMERYQNKKYIELILQHRINFLFNVPTIFIMMSTENEFKNHTFNFVTKVAFGGSPIYLQTYQLLQSAFPNAELHNAYGSTETSSPATLMPRISPPEKVTSVGLAVPVADIRIMKSDGEECEVGEIGELYIKGPMVIEEYWDNEEANLKNFHDGYWQSGDIGMMDNEGYFYILDRKKDMINRGGEKIFSIEVEDVLKKLDWIREAAVIGVPDPIYMEKIKAFIVSDQLQEADIPFIQKHCSAYLAKYKVPDLFEFLDELPRNASGKILKNTLKERRENDVKRAIESSETSSKTTY
ncbi:acyl--CoA ligase [Metabacillus idriensis]|uniref:class I adenylate-forming enzyme family protein n=1 Tax=Metabacillus idriensis TaxID=324768 RepID=UPI00203C4534|nr:class I adenylate-forming enzyme family protein [Metabacillus idriensis]MCM3594906.1 acyl--CoA ligase [Metabacillus idriensis]